MSTSIRKVAGVSNLGVEIEGTALDDANLEGYWRLESDGTDSSDSGYDLTPNNAPTHTGGRFGNGAEFDDASSQNYTTTTTTNLEIAGDQTWSAWIKPTTLNGASQGLMSVADGSSDANLFIVATTDVAKIRFVDLGGVDTVSSAAAVTVGEWNHIAATYNEGGGANNLSIWLNGVKASVTATGTQSYGTTTFYLGSNASANYSDAVLDDCAIWSRVLTDAEITELYEGNVRKVSGVINAGLNDDQQYTEGTTEEYYGYTNPDKVGIAQGVKFAASGKLTKMSFQLKKTGSPTGTTTCYLYSDDGSDRPNASLGTFGTLSESTLTTSFVWYNFDKGLGSGVSVTAGTQYHLVLVTTTQHASNYIRILADSTGSYPDGHGTSRTLAGVWSDLGGATNYDLNFVSYMRPSTNIKKIAGVSNV